VITRHQNVLHESCFPDGSAVVKVFILMTEAESEASRAPQPPVPGAACTMVDKLLRKKVVCLPWQETALVPGFFPALLTF
jgi:hypothetical protein